VHGRTLNAPLREALVIEVPHADGRPPYQVRWTENDR